MSRPQDFPHTSGSSVCIVTGGDNGRQDPAQCNKLQAKNPILHGNNINNTDFPFVPIIGACNQRDLETNAPPPEPGSQCLMFSVTGDPSSRVALGVFKDENKTGASAGNMNLGGLKGVTEAFNRKITKKVSKGCRKGTRNGAEIQNVLDGDNWSHFLTNKIQTHAATWPLAGTVLPGRKNIETAVQQFSSILSPSMVSKMPGSFMGISDVISGLTKSQKKKIQDSMPKDVFGAFESTANLMQSSDGSSFSTGGRVNPEVYIANVIDLLSQVTNSADLEGALHRLTYDTELFGLDLLEATEIEVEGAFGVFKQKIDANGNITDEIPEIIQKAIEAFSSMLSSASSAPGASKGDNFFGEAAKTMTDMLGRVEPSIQKFRQAMLSELNTSSVAEIMKKGLKTAATEGGNSIKGFGILG